MRSVILALFLAGLSACGHASDDPAQVVEKPQHESATVPAKE